MAARNFNGDGIDDLLLGASLADAAGNAKPDAGEAYVTFGSATLGGTLDLATTAPDLTVLGVDGIDRMGHRVAAGDVNGDGADDILLGTRFADAAGNAKTDAGEAYVIFGEPPTSVPTPNQAPVAVNDSFSVDENATLTVHAGISTGGLNRDVEITPDGTRAYAVNFGDSTLSVIDIASNQVVGTVTGFAKPDGIAFTADGSRAYVTKVNIPALHVDRRTYLLR